MNNRWERGEDKERLYEFLQIFIRIFQKLLFELRIKYKLLKIFSYFNFIYTI